MLGVWCVELCAAAEQIPSSVWASQPLSFGASIAKKRLSADDVVHDLDLASSTQETNGAKVHTSATTKRRRRQHMLEGIRALKRLVTGTNEWMMQLHATDAG